MINARLHFLVDSRARFRARDFTRASVACHAFRLFSRVLRAISQKEVVISTGTVMYT